MGGMKYKEEENQKVKIEDGKKIGVKGKIIVENKVGNKNKKINGGYIKGIEGGGVIGVMKKGKGNLKIKQKIKENGGEIGFKKEGDGRVKMKGKKKYRGVKKLRGGILKVNKMENEGMERGIGK